MNAQDLEQRARELLDAKHRLFADLSLRPFDQRDVAISVIADILRLQPAPVDLEQFRLPVEAWKSHLDPNDDDESEAYDEADRLLSIIDNAGNVANAEAAAFPMETAPRDGRMLRLLVDFEDHATEDSPEPAWTIGANNFDGNGEDRWRFAGWCWTHDHFTEGKGTPVGWLPMHTEQPAPVVDDAMVSKWPVKVHAAGCGQWAFVAGPRSGTGYPSKQAAREAGEAARRAAIARAQGMQHG